MKKADQMEQVRIGEFVRSYGNAIFQYCQDHPDELPRLMDGTYSNRVFRLNKRRPFCLEETKIPSEERKRYWTRYPFIVNGKRTLICSQWFDWQWDAFCDYLASKGITTQEAHAKFPTLADAGESAPTPRKSSNRSGVEKHRYGSRAIGNEGIASVVR